MIIYLVGGGSEKGRCVQMFWRFVVAVAVAVAHVLAVAVAMRCASLACCTWYLYAMRCALLNIILIISG